MGEARIEYIEGMSYRFYLSDSLAVEFHVDHYGHQSRPFVLLVGGLLEYRMNEEEILNLRNLLNSVLVDKFGHDLKESDQ